jgi:hypothetical protein
LNQDTNTEKLSVVVAEFVMGGWIVLRLKGGDDCLLQKKYIKKNKGERILIVRS